MASRESFPPFLGRICFGLSVYPSLVKLLGDFVTAPTYAQLDPDSHETSATECCDIEVDEDLEDEPCSAHTVHTAANRRFSCFEAHEMLANKGFVIPIQVLEKTPGRVYKHKHIRLLEAHAATVSVYLSLRLSLGISVSLCQPNSNADETLK